MTEKHAYAANANDILSGQGARSATIAAAGSALMQKPTLFPSADAGLYWNPTVFPAGDDANFGTTEAPFVGYWYDPFVLPMTKIGEYRLLIKFNLAGLDTAFATATLRLTASVGGWGGGDLVPFYVALVKRDWIEGTGNGAAANDGEPTWNSSAHNVQAWQTAGCDGAADRGAFGASVLPTDVAGEATWLIDVADIMTAWLVDGTPNYGLLVASPAPAGPLADEEYRASVRARDNAVVAGRARILMTY